MSTTIYGLESVFGGNETTTLNKENFSKQISDTTSDTLSRSISPFAEAGDEEKNDEETEKTFEGQLWKLWMNSEGIW